MKNGDAGYGGFAYATGGNGSNAKCAESNASLGHGIKAGNGGRVEAISGSGGIANIDFDNQRFLMPPQGGNGGDGGGATARGGSGGGILGRRN